MPIEFGLYDTVYHKEWGYHYVIKIHDDGTADLMDDFGEVEMKLCRVKVEDCEMPPYRKAEGRTLENLIRQVKGTRSYHHQLVIDPERSAIDWPDDGVILPHYQSPGDSYDDDREEFSDEDDGCGEDHQ